MATAAFKLDAPTGKDLCVERLAGASGVLPIIEAVQDYLESRPKAHVASLQKIDGGWAPFDGQQQPLPVVSPSAVHCIRDAIHSHCLALCEASIEPTPELLELDRFFYAASKKLESCGEAALQWRSRASRTPDTRTHRDMFANW